MRLGADQEGPLEKAGEAEIFSAVRGANPAISPALALGELVRRELPGITAALVEVMREPSSASKVKSTAIHELGRRIDPQAKAVLIETLHADLPEEVRMAADSLGKTGDEEALRALTELKLPDDHLARRTVGVAARLIAFRNGIDGFRFKRPDMRQILELGSARSVEMESRPVEPGQIEANLKRIKREVPGIELAREHALEVECLGNRLWLMHQAEIEGAGGLTRLAEVPGVPMVAMAFADCTERLYLYAYVMSQPGEKGVELYATRLRGEITHFGEALVDADKASFKLQALNTRFAPAIELEGTFSRPNGELSLATARVSKAVLENQEPRRRPAEAAPLGGPL